MNSRERVRHAIDFAEPDRIPLFKGPDADLAGVGWRPARDFEPAAPGLTEWGYALVSRNAAAGDQGQVLAHPLADWQAFERFVFPDPHARGRMDGVAEQVQALHAQGKYVYAALGKGPMHLLDVLRGFEAYLMDLLCAPERIDLLLEGIFAWLSGLTEAFAGLGVDAVMLTDDQAMQTGPVFSMELWREHFLPRYQELFSQAHARGCHVILHTCGHLGAHLPGLVEAGADVLDNKQPALWRDHPHVDAVRGRVCFSTCLDIQSCLPTIANAEIEAAVAKLVGRLATPAGGFIANPYTKPDLDIDPAKNARMMAAFRAFAWRVPAQEAGS